MADTLSKVGVEFSVYNRMGSGVNSVARDINRIEGSFRSMQRAMQVVAGSAGLYALGRTLTASVRAARDAAESENLFTVSLEENAAAARAWSKEVSQALQLNEYTLRKDVGTFSAMFDALGVGAQQAYEMSRALTVLARDMASFYNLGVEEAFQKLQAGISGEVEPLKRLGVVVNETTAKEFALRQGWIKQGETLSEVGKVYARYGAILEQTGRAQGDLARTADSAANVERSLAEAWQMQKVEIGRGLLPAYADLAKAMRDSMGETAKFISQQVEGFLAIWEAAQWLKNRLQGKEAMPQGYYAAAKQQYRQTVGSLDPQAFQRVMQETGLEGEQSPRYMQKWHEILGHHIAEWERDRGQIVDPQVAELRRRAAELSKPASLTPPPGVMVGPAAGGGAGRGPYTDDESQALRRLAGDLNRRSQESFAARVKILEEERARYAQFVQDKALLDAWYRDQYRQLSIERAKINDDFFAGWRSGVQEMHDQLESLGQLGADSAKMMRDAWVSGTWDMIAEGRKLSDVVRGIGLDFAKMAYQWGMNQMFTRGLGLVGAMFGGGAGAGTVPAGDMNPALASVAHGGGLIGSDGLPRRAVPAGLWAGAPRLHGGLAPDEFPAILQRGERVVPRGQAAAGTLELHVYDQSGRGLDIDSGEIRQEEGRTVMAVIARDRRRRGPLSRGG
jgi:hypothetical protein